MKRHDVEWNFKNSNEKYLDHRYGSLTLARALTTNFTFLSRARLTTENQNKATKALAGRVQIRANGEVSIGSKFFAQLAWYDFLVIYLNSMWVDDETAADNVEWKC